MRLISTSRTGGGGVNKCGIEVSCSDWVLIDGKCASGSGSSCEETLGDRGLRCLLGKLLAVWLKPESVDNSSWR